MNLTEKNGQPSMEEILASIRRIIAEEPSGGPQPIELKDRNGPMLADSVLDDHGDFDLPAIFRATPATTPEKTPLFGRLTDAIRGAAGSHGEGKKTNDEPRAELADDTAGRPDSGYPTLSSLKAHGGETQKSDGRPGEPGAGDALKKSEASAAPAVSAAPAASSWSFARSAPIPAASEEEFKRVMAPFKCTRFKEMAPGTPGGEPGSSTLGTPAPLVPVAPEPLQRVDFGTIVPASMDRPADRPGPNSYPEPQQAWRPGSQAAAPAQPFAGRPDISSMPPVPAHAPFAAPIDGRADPAFGMPPFPGRLDGQPPPFPSAPSAGGPVAVRDAFPTGTIEDATAELLRPMLRQWLADNMPRMVEKALHIEVAESVKPGKKLTGQ